MTDFSLVTAFLIGLAGGVHCVGMCGGITLAMRAASPNGSSHLPFALSYHSGRIISYTIAGSLSGFAGLMISTSSSLAAVLLQYFGIAMLILMALYIGQWYRGLTYLEKLGARLWRHIQPFSQRFIPFKTPFHAFPYGMVWGWLPCGLVYSTLSWSLASGSVVEGALIMLAFGAGTFPTMIAASLSATYLLAIFKHRLTRQIIAFSLILYAFILVYATI